MPAAFTRNPDLKFPGNLLQDLVAKATKQEGCTFLDATQLATQLLGDSVYANLLLCGYAYQMGLLPVGHEAMAKAIELNGVQVDKNLQAFQWGRLAYHDRAAFDRLGGFDNTDHPASTPQTLETLIEHRATHLRAYQNARYADRYRKLVERVGQLDATLGQPAGELTSAVARYYAKVLAYKDEYEVARLFTQAEFWTQLDEQFDGDYRVHFNLAPPFLAKRDQHSGLPIKRELGPWVRPLFGLLAKLRGLRGTRFDPFGYSADRVLERTILQQYEAIVEHLIEHTRPDNYATAVELASTPEQIRGYGHIKARHYEAAQATIESLLSELVRSKDERRAA